jgi:hypothetical protein
MVPEGQCLEYSVLSIEYVAFIATAGSHIAWRRNAAIAERVFV